MQRELNANAHRLNMRPRKCLNFATPLEVSAQLHPHSPLHLELETAGIIYQLRHRLPARKGDHYANSSGR
jgi:hypothetical protein